MCGFLPVTPYYHPSITVNSGQAALTMAPDEHVIPPALPPLTLAATFGHGGLRCI